MDEEGYQFGEDCCSPEEELARGLSGSDCTSPHIPDVYRHELGDPGDEDPFDPTDWDMSDIDITNVDNDEIPDEIFFDSLPKSDDIDDEDDEETTD